MFTKTVAEIELFETAYVYENQFRNPGFTNGGRQFCGYQYFCYEILFYFISSYSPSPFYLESLKGVFVVVLDVWMKCTRGKLNCNWNFKSSNFLFRPNLLILTLSYLIWPKGLFVLVLGIEMKLLNENIL